MLLDRLPSDWQQVLQAELQKPYFTALLNRVEKVYTSTPGQIYPPKSQLFAAFQFCALANLKVVILGQDPYPTKGHANGLCFSVGSDIRPLPKSLNNILKERKTDLQVPDLPNGNLEHWAKQGVLLLNTVLTVEEGKPDSHKNWGWEKFTDAVIQIIAAEKQQVVFILWGAKAQTKAVHIDSSKHLILKAVHPSPLAAHRGFFGCKHFSKTNAFLRLVGAHEIQW